VNRDGSGSERGGRGRGAFVVCCQIRCTLDGTLPGGGPFTAARSLVAALPSNAAISMWCSSARGIAPRLPADGPASDRRRKRKRQAASRPCQPGLVSPYWLGGRHPWPPNGPAPPWAVRSWISLSLQKLRSGGIPVSEDGALLLGDLNAAAWAKLELGGAPGAMVAGEFAPPPGREPLQATAVPPIHTG